VCGRILGSGLKGSLASLVRAACRPSCLAAFAVAHEPRGIREGELRYIGL
jgi:hypothetical protein